MNNKTEDLIDIVPPDIEDLNEGDDSKSCINCKYFIYNNPINNTGRCINLDNIIDFSLKKERFLKSIELNEKFLKGLDPDSTTYRELFPSMQKVKNISNDLAKFFDIDHLEPSTATICEYFEYGKHE